MRSICRRLFLATMAVALLPAIGLLLLKPGDSPHMMTLLNRCFGMGVFAQTFLRAALMIKWLAWSRAHGNFTVSPLTAARHEQILLSSLLVLTQAVGGSDNPAPAAGASPASRET